MRDHQVNSDVRLSQEYVTGREAYERQMSVDDCPWATGDMRLRWLCGWYDARMVVRMGGVLRKYGLVWP